jgi:hypothetical protein
VHEHVRRSTMCGSGGENGHTQAKTPSFGCIITSPSEAGHEILRIQYLSLLNPYAPTPHLLSYVCIHINWEQQAAPKTSVGGEA